MNPADVTAKDTDALVAEDKVQLEAGADEEPRGRCGVPNAACELSATGNVANEKAPIRGTSDVGDAEARGPWRRTLAVVLEAHAARPAAIPSPAIRLTKNHDLDIIASDSLLMFGWSRVPFVRLLN